MYRGFSGSSASAIFSAALSPASSSAAVISQRYRLNPQFLLAVEIE